MGILAGMSFPDIGSSRRGAFRGPLAGYVIKAIMVRR